MTDVFFEDIAMHIEKEGVCTFEQAMEYIKAENDCFSILGLNVYDEGVDANDLLEYEVENEEEIIEYILTHTNLDKELVKEIDRAYFNYLNLKGLLDPGTICICPIELLMLMSALLLIIFIFKKPMSAFFVNCMSQIVEFIRTI